VRPRLQQRRAGRLLDLLPDDLAAQVGDWLRRPEALTAGASSGLEVALLARSTFPDDDDDDFEEPPSTQLPEALLARMMASAPAVGRGAAARRTSAGYAGRGDSALATSTQLSVARPLTRQERSLLEELRRQSSAETFGVHPACAMLRALRGTRRLRRALTATAKVDAEAATIIQSHLFDFEDLIRLRSQELQLLLGRVDNATLARSLVDADEVVAQRLFANASDRRAVLLRDEMELYAELTPAEVELARSDIMATVRTLYERGDITTYFGSPARHRRRRIRGRGWGGGGCRRGGEWGPGRTNVGAW
jgi:hypothetical protein